MVLQDYWRKTRRPLYSITLALPLLLLYEGSAALMSQGAHAGVRNGAGVLLKTLFLAAGGRTGLLVFGLALLGGGAYAVWHDVRKHPTRLHPSVWALMLGECLVYAAVLGSVVANLTGLLLPNAVVQGATFQQLPLATQLVVSLGAGLYEELLFRVLLVSGLLLLGKRLGLKRAANIAVAIALSALIFSAFHYIGPYGDTLTLPSFVFRAVAGVLLSGLYVARGFGIVTWTHAMYDIGLALQW